METFIKILSIVILLSSTIFVYSQYPENSPNDNAVEKHYLPPNLLNLTDTVTDPVNRQKVISLNFGAGYGLFAGPMLSANVIAEISDEFHFSTGADVYVLNNNGEYSPDNSWQFNAVPYYVWNSGKQSIFRLGLGAALNPRFYPVLSFKYDYLLLKAHTVGAEFKTMYYYGPFVFPSVMIHFGYRIGF